MLPDRPNPACLVLPAWHCLQDNLIHGRFLAELTQEVLNDLEASKYQHTGEWVGGWVGGCTVGLCR